MAGTIIPGGVVFPTAPTAPQGTTNNLVATTAFVTTYANTKANIVSPTLTGTPTVPTASITARDTQIASTAFVVAAVNSAVPLPTQPTVTAPASAYGGSVNNTIRPSGSTSVVGGNISYSIKNVSVPGVVFSKTASIAENEPVTFSVPFIGADTVLTFDVVAVVGVRESIPRTVSVSLVALPATFGQFWQGGYYFGRIQVGSDTYLLVTAPKATGQTSGLALKTNVTATAGTSSLNDGLANSNSMNNATHPAAQWCRSLSINGFTDWYLPARDELELLYRNLKPTTNNNQTGFKAPGDPDSSSYGFMGVNAFSVPNGAQYTTTDPAVTAATAFLVGGAEALPDGGIYLWSSSQNAGATATGTKGWVQVTGGAQSGLQNLVAKTDGTAITRAIRRVKVD